MRKDIQEEIVATACDYVGQEEIRGNLGFKDEEFARLMKAVGWEKKQAWCAYFAELVWKMAYQKWDATMFIRLDKLFSASAVTTFHNFEKSKDFVVNKQPKPGCLVVWQNYKEGQPHWTGHIGMVNKVQYKKKLINTIEGNTNNNGEREGFEVASKMRALDFSVKDYGLVLLGFIHPKEV